MDKTLQDDELQLARFGEYLLKNQLVPENRARFNVLWVRKFLTNKLVTPGISLEDRVAHFFAKPPVGWFASNEGRNYRWFCSSMGWTYGRFRNISGIRMWRRR
jgi:hypothetical protein